MTHVVPFQRSASVTWLPLALTLGLTSPTAVHAVAELHDTESRMASLRRRPGGRWEVGAGVNVHGL